MTRIIPRWRNEDEQRPTVHGAKVYSSVYCGKKIINMTLGFRLIQRKCIPSTFLNSWRKGLGTWAESLPFGQMSALRLGQHQTRHGNLYFPACKFWEWKKIVQNVGKNGVVAISPSQKHNFSVICLLF